MLSWSLSKLHSYSASTIVHKIFRIMVIKQSHQLTGPFLLAYVYFNSVSWKKNMQDTGGKTKRAGIGHQLLLISNIMKFVIDNATQSNFQPSVVHDAQD